MNKQHSLTVNIHSGHYKEPDIHLPELPEFSDTSVGDAYIAGNRMNSLYFHAPGGTDWAVVDNWGSMRERYMGDSGKVNREWISVKDRLPALPDVPYALIECLVVIAGRVFPALYRCTPENGTRWSCWYESKKIFDASVTHWMPLPSPPSDCK